MDFKASQNRSLIKILFNYKEWLEAILESVYIKKKTFIK